VERGDADRALVVRLAAFAEAPAPVDLDPLLRLAQITQRFGDLPLDEMTRLVDINDDASPRRLTEIAAAWRELGRGYRAADCLERVLALAPTDAHANEALELFYRSTGEWPVLIDLLGRRAVQVDGKERAELFREMGLIYERELGDDSGALDAYREADRLSPTTRRARPWHGSSCGLAAGGEAMLTLVSPRAWSSRASGRVWLRAADIAQAGDTTRPRR
jgi:tetratricopeptide (TPR) repeat protein